MKPFTMLVNMNKVEVVWSVDRPKIQTNSILCFQKTKDYSQFSSVLQNKNTPLVQPEDPQHLSQSLS